MNTNSFLNSQKVFIIAEAGVNHDGDLNKARKLVDVAHDAKADAVKFQTFKPGEITGKFAFKVDYQAANTNASESRYVMSARLALSYEAFDELQRYCKKKKILFLSTPDGDDSLDFLVDQLDIPIIKVGSSEITHHSFLERIARKKRPIILSTGMSTMAEVKTAVSIITKHNKQVVLLHCTTEYPTLDNEVNLKAMVSLKDEFKFPVGYSDHTIGTEAAIAAVALGARVIEKHFTLNRKLAGPDHRASLDPGELRDFVIAIRRTEKMLGDGVKKPTASELKNISGVRRGIVAAKPIKKGMVLTRELLTFKRPNTGIQPFEIEKVLGKKLKKDLEEDEVLQWEHLS